MPSTFVVLGDTHFPFHRESSLLATYALIKRMKPDYVVQIGDLYDMYSFSRFSKNPNYIKPEEEMETGRDAAEKMWELVKIASPTSARIQLYGNHDLRPAKYIKELAPAALHVIKKYVKEMMTFKGVELVDDEHEIDKIIFMHGFRKLGEHAKWNQQSTVVGHSHRPGIVYDMNRSGPYFELNVGWLGDPEAEAFSYGAQKKLHKMHNGVGIIDPQGPRFVHL